MNKIEIDMRKREEQWQAESDMRTLVEAEQIKRDPKRLKRAQECARKKLTEVASVAGGSDPD